ncbi:hypothetical protein LshimejAT787_0804030 [Lyophyllum shimeji]|uniref:Uncharacterized protein n=1 Tax=Lyophyllum shimeji TaxID=47721 RepID=A0A9P3PSH2_LYOSH|nr:hypothetical protein LshimejAT787_0804030 [Lyophyllum shimeji]
MPSIEASEAVALSGELPAPLSAARKTSGPRGNCAGRIHEQTANREFMENNATFDNVMLATKTPVSYLHSLLSRFGFGGGTCLVRGLSCDADLV